MRRRGGDLRVRIALMPTARGARVSPTLKERRLRKCRSGSYFRAQWRDHALAHELLHNFLPESMVDYAGPANELMSQYGGGRKVTKEQAERARLEVAKRRYGCPQP